MDLDVKNIAFREIQESDLPDLYQIYGSTRIEELDKGTDWSEEQKQLFIQQQFLAQHDYYQKNYLGAKFYVIEKENTAIGRLYIDYFFEEKGFRIIDIALLPEWRGKKIGTAILEAILKKAKQEKMPVSIHVESFNPAMKWYYELGFTKISETNGVYFLLEWRSF